MNLKELTDEATSTQLRIDVLTEREQRAALAEIPAQITELAAKPRYSPPSPDRCPTCGRWWPTTCLEAQCQRGNHLPVSA